MIRPEEIENMDEYDLSEIEKQIDAGIKSRHGWYPWEEATLYNEYPVAVRNRIAARYTANGWKYVYHCTSSENGEKPGLTNFKFSMEQLDDKYVKSSYCVSEIYLKIYVENGDTLVFEGQGSKDKDGYYPTQDSGRFGTSVTGKAHISITEEARRACLRIEAESKHNKNNLNCVDIHRTCCKINGKAFTDVNIYYLGPIIMKLNIEETIHNDDFFTGWDGGIPKIKLLDELVRV